MSYRSIADYLGISISNVHAKRKQIIERLEQNERFGTILTYEKLAV
ncbi:hypothetical protein [Lysinibacillus fusiformis]